LHDFIPKDSTTLAGNSPLLGSFRPLGDFRFASPLNPEGPKLPVRAALRLSQPLDGLLLANPCGLVSCRCHLKGLCPTGGFPFVQHSLLIGDGCPPVVSLARFATRPASWTRLVSSKPRLQGLAPHEGPSSLFRCYTSQGPDPLMSFRPLPGLHSSCRGADFAAPPLMALAFGASAPKSFYPLG
jgi:hypothetical protein